MGLINSATAIENGIDFIDATILGMGRGAGNLKMELLLTYLNKNNNLNVDFNVLGDVITAFNGLYKKYEWGTNLPYMLSGTNSLPQKDVMDWVNNRIYSFNSIIRALDNKKEKKEDNEKMPLFKAPFFENVLIIGGGLNAVTHIDGIKEFIKNNSSIAIIHATARNAVYYRDVEAPQYYCLVGSEAKRLSKEFNKDNFKGTCILPPYPRIMGTDVPTFVHNVTYELKSIDFTNQYQDSCTALALQTAITLGAKNVMVVGYDGYPDGMLSVKERDLSNENRILFSEYKRYSGKNLNSLTPSLYKELEIESVYQYI